VARFAFRIRGHGCGYGAAPWGDATTLVQHNAVALRRGARHKHFAFRIRHKHVALRTA
jgi:hypothetical protein